MKYPIIRTSILPFGYKDGKYRFSLCIDLNPDYTLSDSSPIERDTAINNALEKLMSFFDDPNSSKGYPAIFKLLSDNISVSINGNSLQGEALNNKLHSHKNVKATWQKIFELNDSLKETQAATSGNTVEVDKYTSPISTLNLAPIFEILPESDVVRKSAVASFEPFSNNELNDSDFDEKFNNAVNSEKKNITKFVDTIKGISFFAEEQSRLKSIAQTSNIVTRSGIASTLDDILTIWSFFDSNTILQRLSGIVIDFEIEKGKLENQVGIEKKVTNKDFNINLSFNNELSNNNTIGNLEWEHLITPLTLDSKKNIILVQEHGTILKIDNTLEASNFDRGAHLAALADLEKRYNNYKLESQNPLKTESERYEIRKQMISIDSAALTLGMILYDTSLKQSLNKESEIEKNISKDDQAPYNWLYRITKGYKYAAQSDANPSKFTPIGERSVKVRILGSDSEFLELPEEFAKEEFAIGTDSGSHALIPTEDGKSLEHKVILDMAIMNWTGENIGLQSPFSNPESEDGFEPNKDEGSVDDSTLFITNVLSHLFADDFELKGVQYEGSASKDELGIKPNSDQTTASILVTYDLTKNKKLVFGRSYSLAMTPVLKNGYSAPWDKIIDLNNNDYIKKINGFQFRRNEPVKPVQFFLQDPILKEADKKIIGLAGKKMPVKMREGESINHLVIRNESRKDNGKVQRTSQKSVRYILPPEIPSFQFAMWTDNIFNISPEEAYKWYLKYHFPTQKGQPYYEWENRFRANQDDFVADKSVKNRTIVYSENEAYQGSTMMKEYYGDRFLKPDSIERSQVINYLPDMLCEGFRLEFFLDSSHRIKATDYLPYEDQEYYFSGDYPNIRAWKITIQDKGKKDKNLVYYSDEQITIKVEKGIELFVNARTILSLDYEKELKTYGNYNDFTKYGGNDLLTPPLSFSITHAMQRPVVKPILINATANERPLQDSSIINYTVNTYLEHLRMFKANNGLMKFLPNSLPTGNVEIYAKWENYVDDPEHITPDTDPWTPLMPVNRIDTKRFSHKEGESPATLETLFAFSVENLRNMENSLIKFGNEVNQASNFASELRFSYDVRETKYIEKYLWIKNKSSFTGYYPSDWGVSDSSENSKEIYKSKDYFNSQSEVPLKLIILNNKKPTPPILSEDSMRLVSVIDEHQNGSHIERKSSLNRVRFYIERGRLSSGNGERIGILLNEAKGVYNDFWEKNDEISKVGRDAASDPQKPFDGLYRNNHVLLNKSHINTHDPYLLSDFYNGKPTSDLESFSPLYIEDLGIMTFLPKFDKLLNLWYFETEFDINNNNGEELHSPFLQFSLVHYQENSVNYNKPTDPPNPNLDCRISTIYKTGFVYILGSRIIHIWQNQNSVAIKITLHETSLKKGKNSSESLFFAFVRERAKGEITWKVSKMENSEVFALIDPNNGVKKLKYEAKNKDYQMVVIETESWDNGQILSDLKYADIIDNKNYRIVFTNTFDIN